MERNFKLYLDKSPEWVYKLLMDTKRSIFKRIVVTVLAVLMVMPLVGCTRSKHIVTEAKWAGDCCYAVYDDGTAVLIKYVGEDEILKLPAIYAGRPVMGVSTKTFDGCENLREVYLPESITSLPAKLFNNCPSLTTIYIPGSVTSIGKNVVSECPAFTTVRFGGSEESWANIYVGQVPYTDNYVLINSEMVYNYSTN